MALFPKEKIKKGFLIFCWALYDLSNQFFALNIISLYFPRWLTIEKQSPEIFYSLAFGVSMFFVAVCAPVLGIISDLKAVHRRLLIYFTFLSIVFTLMLGFTPNVFIGLIFFAIANFGCQEAVVFYNSLMIKVAPKNKIGFVSGLGKMFGYSGAILALYLTKPVILKVGYQATFLLTGVLFLIFSLPCLIFVKEAPLKEAPGFFSFLKKDKLVQLINRLKTTLYDTAKYPGLKNFLKAAFFCLCAVNSIVLFMSVYATRAFGLTEVQIINLIAFSTIFAVIGSISSGFISDIIGPRRTLMGVFLLWIISAVAAAVLRQPFQWVVGILVGVSLGSTWVVARALVVKLVPEEKIGEVFGLFNLVGYISGVLGPLIWGIMLLFLASLGELGYRLTSLTLILFITIAFTYLLKMRKELKNNSLL